MEVSKRSPMRRMQDSRSCCVTTVELLKSETLEVVEKETRGSLNSPTEGIMLTLPAGEFLAVTFDIPWSESLLIVLIDKLLAWVEVLTNDEEKRG